MSDSWRFDKFSKDQLRDIHAISENFERAIRRGDSKVGIEQTLEDTPFSLRDALFQELLVIELEWRFKQEANIDPRCYIDRFPNHAANIREVFTELAEENQNHHSEDTQELEQAATSNVQPSDGPGGPSSSFRRSSQSTGSQGTNLADRYILEEKIGEGGMGEVWRASQIAPVKRTVAVKLIKRGLDSNAVLTRFEQERQALALMDHPNIARVLDGGMTEEGHSFFVMEFVDGRPLTKFADEAKLTTAQRLKLFTSICYAVQHAHQKGVVHRDLKPANILVSVVDGNPVPKVIDFGVAKATGGSLIDESIKTQYGAVIGTLEYMAPEQAGYQGDDIDTRADIYSLGVVLYELLTGLRPIDYAQLKEAGVAEIIRFIKEEDPARPSTRLSSSDSLTSAASVRRDDPRKLTALLRGELDWVVMKCLEKDRDRRYETAIGLGRDIERFLAGEMVEARPPSLSYQFKKLLQRNKGAVIAGSLFLAAIIAGITGTTLAWLEALRQAEVARLEATTEAEINAFLRDDILAQASPYTQSDSLFKPNPELKVKTALRRASAAIGERFGDQPLVAAAIHYTIGAAYSDIGEFATAEPHLKESFVLFEKHRGVQHPDTYRAEGHLGYVYRRLDKLDEAQKYLGSALQHCRAIAGDENRETLQCAMAFSHCVAAQGNKGDQKKTQQAKKEYLQILASQRSLFGEVDTDVALTTFALAMIHRAESKALDDPKLLDRAESLVQDALNASSHLPSDHPHRLNFRYGLGLLANDKLEFDRSFRILEEVVAGCVRTYGEVHPTTAFAMDSLASSYSVHSRADDAERLYRKSLEVRRELYGNDHPATIHGIFSLGQFYYNSGDTRKAEPFYRERFESFRRIQGDDDVDSHLAGRDLATILMELGDLDEADQLLKTALLVFEKHFDDDHPIVGLTRSYQADVFVSLGRFEEALKILNQSVKSIRKQKTPHPIELASCLASLGQCQLQLESYQDAEVSFREATKLFTKYIPDAWPSFVYKSKIGAALVGQEKYEEAEPFLIEGFEGVSARKAACPPPLYVETIQLLVDYYDLTGELEKAKPLRDQLAQ